jgi:hypothetical protein
VSRYHGRTIPCPHRLTEADVEKGICDAQDIGTTCGSYQDGEVPVEAAWVPPERNWGADADGNRGIDVPGYWEDLRVTGPCDKCGADGHEWDANEEQNALDTFTAKMEDR